MEETVKCFAITRETNGKHHCVARVHSPSARVYVLYGPGYISVFSYQFARWRSCEDTGLIIPI